MRDRSARLRGYGVFAGYAYDAYLTMATYVPPADALTPGRIPGDMSAALLRMDAPIGTTDVIDIVCAPFVRIPVFGF
jgi:hypothetical protein